MQAFMKIENLQIITTTRGAWLTPGEYSTPGYACIEFECPPDQELARVLSLGDPEPIIIREIEGQIYRNPTVELMPVPEDIA